MKRCEAAMKRTNLEPLLVTFSNSLIVIATVVVGVIFGTVFIILHYKTIYEWFWVINRVCR